MINYLKGCAQIKKLCFISTEIKEGVQSFIPISNERQIASYIDGSVKKYYDFALIEYTGGNCFPLDNKDINKHENIQNYQKLQLLIDWINKQRKEKKYPDLGPGTEVQNMYVLTENPVLSGIENEKLYRYMIQIRIEYIEGDL